MEAIEKDRVNILLVDDQPAKLLGYEAILDDLGERLIKANSGKDAFQHLLKEEIAVVLMDVCMPDVDGFELASMIRQHPRFERTAIILVSAVHMSDLDRLKGYTSGAVDYVSVPIIPEILRAKVTVFAELFRKTKQLERLNQELEQRVAERTAELSRSNEELQQFAYVASHDLQEPLRMVSSYVQLLARRYQGQIDAGADEYIRFALEGSARMYELINALLDYSRIDKANSSFVRVDCGVALARALENLQLLMNESGAEVSRGELPVVRADETQIVQLFQNLVGNAIKFRGPDVPRVHIEARQDARDWVFSVRDNGIGIEPAYAGRIFQLFQRLHGRSEYPGTGIGLSICKKILERHRGRIWVESQPGKGSMFHFTLPQDLGASARPPKTTPASPEPKGARALRGDAG